MYSLKLDVFFCPEIQNFEFNQEVLSLCKILCQAEAHGIDNLHASFFTLNPRPLIELCALLVLQP